MYPANNCIGASRIDVSQAKQSIFRAYGKDIFHVDKLAVLAAVKSYMSPERDRWRGCYCSSESIKARLKVHASCVMSANGDCWRGTKNHHNEPSGRTYWIAKNWDLFQFPATHLFLKTQQRSHFENRIQKNIDSTFDNRQHLLAATLGNRAELRDLCTGRLRDHVFHAISPLDSSDFAYWFCIKMEENSWHLRFYWFFESLVVQLSSFATYYC